MKTLTADQLLMVATDDVIRQARWLKDQGREPVQVRMNPNQWDAIRAAAGVLRVVNITDPADPTFCGLPVRIDSRWDATLAVEDALDLINA